MDYLNITGIITNTETEKREFIFTEELVTWQYLTYSKSSGETPLIRLWGRKINSFVNDQLSFKMNFNKFRTNQSLNDCFETLKMPTYKLWFF